MVVHRQSYRCKFGVNSHLKIGLDMASDESRTETVRNSLWHVKHVKDVWATCQFRGDVISADFSKAKFAVELHEFLDGTADKTYQNPQEFFDNTFLTDQMKLLVRDTLARLDTGGGAETAASLSQL